MGDCFVHICVRYSADVDWSPVDPFFTASFYGTLNQDRLSMLVLHIGSQLFASAVVDSLAIVQ